MKTHFIIKTDGSWELHIVSESPVEATMIAACKSGYNVRVESLINTDPQELVVACSAKERS